MRVRAIEVKGLFGIFDHHIPLNEVDRITIIHGPNGFGKTILLRMIDHLLQEAYWFLRLVPFSSFAVKFDDQSTLLVEQIERKPSIAGGTPKANLRITLHGAGHPVEPFLLSNREPPPWLRDLLQSVSVRSVHTQRLTTHVPIEDSPSHSTTVPTIGILSQELAEQMQNALEDYAAKSQELDRTFPARLLQMASTAPISSDESARKAEEIKRRLEALEQKRARLSYLGFLDPQDAVPLPSAINPDQIGVLSIYVSDVENKLGVLDKMADKIGLFMEIIRNRFQYKQMHIRRDQGFRFRTAEGEPLSLEALSSGEQHEIVMFYELLFNTSPNSLILIDEPEISLHLAWQVEFLNDLQKIVKLSDFDVLMATHSPDIIGSHWDWTVELKGPAR